MKHLTDKQITEELKRLLVKKHHIHEQKIVKEWILFWELPISSGFSSQFVDAFAINTFPSKKFRKIAYEIKASRADLMKELKNQIKENGQ